jgi:hypothetical protein
MKVPIRTDRHRDHGNKRRAHVAEENENDKQHENCRFDERVLDRFNRSGDERGRVVGDLPGDVIGKRFRAVVQQLFEGLDCGQGIGAGRLIDADKA